jgi:hypothetical protein
MRLTTTQNGAHHVTVPVHDPLRIGTLRSILTDVAAHFGMTWDDLVERLFGAGSWSPRFVME